MRARHLLVPLLILLPALASAAESSTIPITTSSPEARMLYLEGRDLVERLKGTEAHLRTDKAVKLDPQFALAWLQWAQTSGTAKELLRRAGQGSGQRRPRQQGRTAAHPGS